jgi:hypothetical protein
LRVAVAEIGLDDGETLLAQQFQHLRVVVDARHRGVGVPLAQQPAARSGAGTEVDDDTRNRHSGSVQDGCEMVAEHLRIEVEEVVLAVIAGSLVGRMVVVRSRVVSHASTVDTACAFGIVSCV